MSLRTALARALGVQASLENPAVPLNGWAAMLDIMGLGRSDAGVVVNERGALRLGAVQACVRVIAETMASLPLCVYQSVRNGKVEARSNRIWPLLHDAPNEQMTAMTFREAVTAQVLLWGNGYAEIQRDRSGRVVGLWPLASDRTRPVRTGGRLIYETSVNPQVDLLDMSSGPVRFVDPADMIHVVGLSFNGLIGMSPIALARQTIGLSMAAEKFGALFFGSGSRPSGVLSHPGTLKPDARKNLRESFTEATSRDNANKAILLEEGIKWTPMSLPPDEAQFIETRQFQIGEIARIFRVPPHLIQDLSRSTNNNIEQQSIEFVMHTVRPWAVRWEQEILRKLLGGAFYAEHDLSGLLRGDFKSRMEGYQILRNIGVLSANRILAQEGMNPVPAEDGGDLLIVPLNMTSLDVLQRQADGTEPDSAGGGDYSGDDDGNGDEGDGNPSDPNSPGALLRARMVTAYRPLFADAAGRAMKREKRDAKAMRAVFSPAVTALAESLAAFEFTGATPLSADAHVLIAGHAAGIADRAAAWQPAQRERIAADEAGRAYDVLRSKLSILIEEAA